MARLSAQDWVDKGIELLTEEGVHALKLERLCESLHKTKGSFYHHFRDMDNFVGVLLETWAERQTTNPILYAETQISPGQKLKRLGERVSQLDNQLDQMIRVWSTSEPRARMVLEQVDRRRLRYLSQCFQELGCDQSLADTLAEMQYIALLGAQQRYARLDSPQALHIAQCFQTAIGLYLKSELKLSPDVPSSRK